MPFSLRGWASPLSWPASLPSLPGFSFSLSSLGRQWQRRLLLHLVRRALSGIVVLPDEHGQDHNDALEQSTFLTADLSAGSLVLTKLKLDVDGINARLAAYTKALPVEAVITSGRVGKVHLVLGDAVPDTPSLSPPPPSGSSTSATDRLLNAPIHLALHDIDIDIRATPSVTRKGESNEPNAHALLPDLSASILHAAKDYVQEEILSSSEAFGSNHDDRSELADAEDDDPFASLPGAFASTSRATQENKEEQVGLVAYVIERLLSRLQVEVQNVRVRVTLEDAEGQEELEFRLAKLESAARVQEAGENAPGRKSISRNVTLTKPEIWLRSARPYAKAPREGHGHRSPQGVKPVDIVNEPYPPSPDSEDDMVMSMAIADLRDSTPSASVTTDPRASEPDHRTKDKEFRQSSGSDTLSDSSFEGEDMFFSTLGGNGTTSTLPARPNGSSSTPVFDPPTTQDGSKAVETPGHAEASVEKEWQQMLGLLPSPSMQSLRERSTDRSGLQALAQITFVTSSGRGESGSNQNHPDQHRLELVLPTLCVRCDPEQISAFLGWWSRSVTSPSERELDDSTATKSAESSVLLYATIGAIECCLALRPRATPIPLVRPDDTSTEREPSLQLSLLGVEGAYRAAASPEGKLAIRSYSLDVVGADGAVSPVVLPDGGLAWQYASTDLCAGDSIPSHGDWRASSSEQSQRQGQWQRQLPLPPAGLRKPTTRIPVLNDAVAMRWKGVSGSIVLQPIHIWIDLPLLLNAVPPLLQRLQPNPAIGPASGAHSAQRPTTTSTTATDPLRPGYNVDFTCACIRVEFRCPNPTSGDLRAGLATVDVRDVQIGMADPYESASVRFHRVFAFMATRHKPLRSTCFLQLDGEGKTAQATVNIALSPPAVSAAGPSPRARVRCALGDANAWLNKPLLDGLQYLADDLGQTFNSSPGNAGAAGSAQDFEAAFASIGKATRSVRTPLLALMVREVSLKYMVPSGTLKGQRKMALRVTQVHVAIESRQARTTELVVDTSVQSASLEDKSDDSIKPKAPLFCRLGAASSTPLFSLRLTSFSDADTLVKHSKVQIKLASILCSSGSDISFAVDLATALKAPPDAFVDVVPSETTEIEVILREGVMRVLPMTLDSTMAVQLSRLAFSTKLVNGQAGLSCLVDAERLEVWVADEARSGKEGEISLGGLGYASLLRLDALHSSIVRQTGPPANMEVDIAGLRAAITACPDTLLVLSTLLADFAPPPVPKPLPPPKSVADLSGSIIMPRAGQPEKRATARPERIVTPSTLTENEDETVHLYGADRIKVDRDWLTAKPEPPASSLSASPTLSLHMAPSDITISLYEGYDFERTRKYVRKAVKATRRRLEKIRQLLAEGQMPEETVDEAADYLLQSVFLPSRLHSARDSAEGEPEMDTVRRVVAFDDELDNDNDEREETASADQSWESLHDRSMQSRGKASASNLMTADTPQSLQSSRLKRPKQSALDARLEGLDVRFEAFDAQASAEAAQVASRIALNVGNLSVVDNMKSSTWHKFLTELRPRDGGVLRPTGSPMVRVQLKMVRSQDSGGEEADLRVKVSPLRLHVDQDALDFIKAFAAFKMDDADVTGKAAARYASLSSASSRRPSAISPAPIKSNSGGFVQRVEILAIKIKLDYKPKRVDYRALQRGQTIEMMNFFSFEASEMVLRRLVLSGPGTWARVGDLLQDIWTPDVKSNQLADFLAGIDPVRSVVNLGNGVADLVLLPVQQYRKDGRLGRGVQTGTSRFAKTTVLEAVKLGARLASGTQVILERAEHLLGGRGGVVVGSVASTSSPAAAGGNLLSRDLLADALDGSIRDHGYAAATVDEPDDSDPALQALHRRDALSHFSQQPTNAREGLQSAYRSLSGNVKSAAETILAVPMEVYERSSGEGGREGPVRAVVRAVPVAVLRSGIGASQAVRETLLGLRNQMDPGAQEEIADKYKRPPSRS